jgi:hypothetical protein
MPTTVHITDQGNQTISGIKTFATGIVAPNIVYNTGNQTISGDKNFLDNINVSGSGIFNALDLNNVDILTLSGVDVSITNGNIILTNRPTVNGTGVLLSGEASTNIILPQSIIYSTGQQIISGNKIFVSGATFSGQNINIIDASLNLSGVGDMTFSQTNINFINAPVYISGTNLRVSGDISAYNIYTTGNLNVRGNINNSALVYNTGNQNINGLKIFGSNTFFSNDANIAQNLRVTGSSYFNDNLYLTGNLTVGGSINNPNLVLTKSKQIISGEKTFANNMSINAYTGNGYDASNLDLKLNIGGDINENAGIQIDAYGTNPSQILMRRARGTPTGLSGVLKDDILFNLQARGYVSGLDAYSTNSRAAIRLIAAEDWVGRAGYTGQGTYILFRTTNIASGLAMDKILINTSGFNVLDGNIYISGNPVVNTTSDQTISGIKTFATGVNIRGKVGIGIDSNNNFDLYVRKSPAGVTVHPDAGSIAVFEGSGNSHITVLASNAQTAGVVLGSPADNFGSYLSWNYDNNALKLATAKPSGFIQILTNDENEAVRITRSGDVGIGTISPSEKLQVVGNILANNLVYNTGNQTISGIKTFASIPTVNNTGILLSGQNNFILNFLSNQANTNASLGYIGAFAGGYGTSAVDRAFPVLENSTAKKILFTLQPGTNVYMQDTTGYFINTTTATTGTIPITTSVGTANTIYNHTANINVPINNGDNVVCLLKTSGVIPTLRSSVQVYLYN